MKIVLLTASPRNNSTSEKLARAFLSFAPNGAEIIVYNAYKMSVHPCDACNYCSSHNSCVHRDMDDFLSDLVSCELFALATPVYNSSMPSPLKAVFDRFQLYYSMRFAQSIKPPIASHRDAALFITSGCQNSPGARIIKEQVEMQFTVMNTTLTDTVYFGGTDKSDLSVDESKARGREYFGR